MRRGDLFGILIEYHFDKAEYNKCFEYLKKMKERGIIITPYVDKEIVRMFRCRLILYTVSWESARRRRTRLRKRSLKIYHHDPSNQINFVFIMRWQWACVLCFFLRFLFHFFHNQQRRVTFLTILFFSCSSYFFSHPANRFTKRICQLEQSIK